MSLFPSPPTTVEQVFLLISERMDASDYATAICGLLRTKELLDFCGTMRKVLLREIYRG